MTIQKNYRQQDSESEQPHALRSAFDRTTQWFGNLFSLLVIITYAKNAQEAFEFVVNRPILSVTFAFLFIAIFSYNLSRNLRVQFKGWARMRASQVQHKEQGDLPSAPIADNVVENAQESPEGHALWRWAAIIGSAVALILVVYIYVLVFVTGLYYVVVASAPNKESAMHEIQSLNHFFKVTGYPDLEARAHASTASGSPWYMISIGGWHTSREAAEVTFRRAKEAMGPMMRPDAYIYSTENISPRLVIVGWIRRHTPWFRQTGD